MIIARSRHLFRLLLIYTILLLGGILLIRLFGIALQLQVYASLLTIMTLITLSAYLLITAGMRKGEKEQGIYLLAGLGGKFLAYLIVILVYWAVGKNLTKEFIIVFFVLYLLLSIFLIEIIYKALKTN